MSRSLTVPLIPHPSLWTLRRLVSRTFARATGTGKPPQEQVRQKLAKRLQALDNCPQQLLLSRHGRCIHSAASKQPP